MTQRVRIPSPAERMRKQRRAKILGDFFGEYWWIVILGVVIVFGFGFLAGRLTNPKCMRTTTPTQVLVIPTPTPTPFPFVTATIAPTAAPTNQPTMTATLAPSSTPITIATVRPTVTESPFLEAPSGSTYWVILAGMFPLPEDGGIAIVGSWRRVSDTDYTKPESGPGQNHTWYYQVTLGEVADRQKMINNLSEFLRPYIGKEIVVDYNYNNTLPGDVPVFIVTVDNNKWKNGGVSVK